MSERSSSSNKARITWSDSTGKAHTAIKSLSTIVPSLSPSLLSSESPAAALLHDSKVAADVTGLLRRPDSGAVNDNLCAWLYDTFHANHPDLHLLVLRFLPTIAAVYLSRAAGSLNHPLAGFESVLLAIYAHETAARNGQAITVTIPDLSHPTLYHDGTTTSASTKPPKSSSSASGVHLGVISPAVDPHGTVRSTRRARIVGVGLELYYTKIAQIPLGSKIEFCQFCKTWSGQDAGSEKSGRINLPWDLLRPILRILGHCLMGPDKKNEKLFRAALEACRCLNARALHDINSKAILATGSLVKLGEMAPDVDYTEIDMGNVTRI